MAVLALAESGSTEMIPFMTASITRNSAASLTNSSCSMDFPLLIGDLAKKAYHLGKSAP